MRSTPWLALLSLVVVVESPIWAGQVGDAGATFLEPPAKRTILLGLGDSTVHGTMDATNNTVNTTNAFLQRIAESLSQITSVEFRQPLLDESGRPNPTVSHTDELRSRWRRRLFYGGYRVLQTVGAPESFITKDYLCDQLFPHALSDKYDKVMYPINLFARKDVSQVDAAIWRLNRSRIRRGRDKALVIVWIGNNDSVAAALGSGGENPTFLPLPVDQIAPEFSPLLQLLLLVGEAKGLVSFRPYEQSAIERNLTEPEDFLEQYENVVSRLETEGGLNTSDIDVVLLTLPYYSSVGHLFDSEDIEFYLQKINPDYIVPPSFTRVTPPGVPIADPTAGDRISFLTFGFMYLLLDTGYSIEEVNTILEVEGEQNDGLVLSEAEQDFITARIDEFNHAIETVAIAHTPRVHVVDLGQYLNDGLTGKTKIEVGGRVLSRKWVRGSSFSLDGVHAGYTAQALIANFVLEQMNSRLGLGAPVHDLSAILATDPYVDRDGDGWARGPDYRPSGLTELLFLFKDPSDEDPLAEPVIPDDVWDRVSNVFINELLGIGSLAAEAERMGIRTEDLR